MNIFVTGSNGFIGKTVVDKLKKTNYIIGCGTREQPNSDVDYYIKWNIGFEDVPKELIDKKIEAIIHIAANKSTDDFDLELSCTNIIGSHRIINLCKEKGCKKVVLLSGLPIIRNFANEIILEDNPYDPPTMYHATKAAQELMFNQLKKQGVRLVTLRIPSPIAPTMKDRTIFTIFGERALNNEPITINGKGTRRQNYIDTRDIASVCEKLLLSEKAEGVYNIGAEKTVSNIELAQKWIDITNSNSEIVFSGNSDPADNQDWMADISRLQRDIGYKQEYAIERTMAEYMKEKGKTGKK